MVLYVSNYKAKSKEKMQVLLLKLELNNKILIKSKDNSSDLLSTQHKTTQRSFSRIPRAQRVDIVFNQMKSMNISS